MEQAKKGIGLAPNAPLKKGDKLPVSGRMVRVKSAIRRLHRKIRNQRNNAQHQLTAELTKRFGMIAIEDLGVKGMTASASLKAKTQRAEKKGKTVKPGTITRKRQKAGLNRDSGCWVWRSPPATGIQSQAHRQPVGGGGSLVSQQQNVQRLRRDSTVNAVVGAGVGMP